MAHFSEAAGSRDSGYTTDEIQKTNSGEVGIRMRPAVGSFAVMSFNVNGQPSMHHDDPTKRWSDRIPVVKHILDNEVPEVIGFQEFGETTKEDVLDTWDENPYDVYRGERVNDIFINTIAWNTDRYEMRESSTRWLTPDGEFGKAWGGIERGYSIVLLESLQTNQPLWVYNLHLDNQSALARLEAMKLVLRNIEERTDDLPTVITGDLNTVTWPMPDPPLENYYEDKAPVSARSDQELFKHLEAAGFIDTNPARSSEKQIPQPTFHAYLGEDIYKQPDRWGTWNPDGIYVLGLAVQSFKIITAHLDGVYPSDHCPIKAVLSETASAESF